jgi:thiamine pyrophosphate-dependent acetolactate synthase large subunit-like protein
MSHDDRPDGVPGYEAFPKLIEMLGSDVVFAMLGETNAPWIAAGVRAGLIRYVRTRHESAAISAAVAHARVTGRVGVASVTRGPGFANAVNALRAAAVDHVPLLLVVAESPSSEPRVSPDYQSIDQEGICRSLQVGFWAARSWPDLHRNFWSAAAATRTDGTPQVLSVADGVWLERASVAGPPETAEDDVDITAEDVGPIVEAIQGARQPLILAGQGALNADARDELDRLADLSDAWVTSTLNVNSFFAGNARSIGFCGHSAAAPTMEMVRKCDLLLSFGASLNNYTTIKGELLSGKTVIQIDSRESATIHATAPELALLADARVAARVINDELEARGASVRRAAAPSLPRTIVQASVVDAPIPHDPAAGLDIRKVFDVCDKALHPDRVVVSDSGRWCTTLPSIVGARDGRSWLTTRGYGSVGLGLGNAIGACVGAQGRQVVLFCGDGGFMMSSADLDAIRLNGLDLLIVILDDSAYGAEVPYIRRHGLPADIARQPLPDIKALASAFGGEGAVVSDYDELADFVSPRPGLRICDVLIDPELASSGALDFVADPAPITQ